MDQQQITDLNDVKIPKRPSTFITIFIMISLLAGFVLNFVSYAKIGIKGYQNEYLHVGMTAAFFIFIISQNLSKKGEWSGGVLNFLFKMLSYKNASYLIFFGGLGYTAYIEYNTGPRLAKTVKDDMGQQVTQEKVLYDTYNDYFVFKLLADIFLFIMFIFILAFTLDNYKPGIVFDHVNDRNMKNYLIGFGYIVFTVLHFVFQSLREEILKNFLTDGFQQIPKKLMKFLKK